MAPFRVPSVIHLRPFGRLSRLEHVLGQRARYTDTGRHASQPCRSQLFRLSLGCCIPAMTRADQKLLASLNEGVSENHQRAFIIAFAVDTDHLLLLTSGTTHFPRRNWIAARGIIDVLI
jgi:hypothetical protein